MMGTARHATNKCNSCSNRINRYPRAASCGLCREEEKVNPFMCEACFVREMERRCEVGTLHKYDPTRDRIYRVGRIPMGSDEEEDKKKKPE